MKMSRTSKWRRLVVIAAFPCFFFESLQPRTARAAPPALAPQGNDECAQCPAARQGLKVLLNGDPDAAIEIFRQIEASRPDSAMGFLLDADATWWRIYLTTANLVDPDVFDVTNSKTSPYDSHFLDLVNTALQQARAKIKARQEVARNELYMGMAYALEARFYGLQDSDLPTARAAKRMRAHLLTAQEADPGLIDVNAGLGLYNYFVDTLPTIIKMLKFVIGLPAGNRELGLQQLQKAAEDGDLVRGEAKFYLAKDFSRWNEKQYAKSLQLFQQMSREYPHNLLWKLLVGSLEIRLGRTQEGEKLYRAVLEESAKDDSEIHQAFHRAAAGALERAHNASSPP